MSTGSTRYTPIPSAVTLVDLGAFTGTSAARFCKVADVAQAYLWECHPEIQIKPPQCPHEVIRAAAWTEDGVVDFYPGEYQGKPSQGSSLVREKTTGWLDYDKPLTVDSVDFAAWLHAHDDGALVVKMNVEGAEYAILPHLFAYDALALPREWHISWHNEKVGVSHDMDEAWREVLRNAGFSSIPSPFPGHEGWRR